MISPYFAQSLGAVAAEDAKNNSAEARDMRALQRKAAVTQQQTAEQNLKTAEIQTDVQQIQYDGLVNNLVAEQSYSMIRAAYAGDIDTANAILNKSKSNKVYGHKFQDSISAFVKLEETSEFRQLLNKQGLDKSQQDKFFKNEHLMNAFTGVRLQDGSLDLMNDSEVSGMIGSPYDIEKMQQSAEKTQSELRGLQLDNERKELENDALRNPSVVEEYLKPYAEATSDLERQSIAKTRIAQGIDNEYDRQVANTARKNNTKATYAKTDQIQIAYSGLEQLGFDGRVPRNADGSVDEATQLKQRQYLSQISSNVPANERVTAAELEPIALITQTVNSLEGNDATGIQEQNTGFWDASINKFLSFVSNEIDPSKMAKEQYESLTIMYAALVSGGQVSSKAEQQLASSLATIYQKPPYIVNSMKTIMDATVTRLESLQNTKDPMLFKQAFGSVYDNAKRIQSDLNQRSGTTETVQERDNNQITVPMRQKNPLPKMTDDSTQNEKNLYNFFGGYK